MKKYQVVIVGAGPVGLGLAIELDRRGVSCALVERRTEISPVPKGQSLQQRTLEHFHFWGIADELRAARTMPDGYPIGDIVAYGKVLTDIWEAPAGRELVGNFFYQANDRLPQYCTEAVQRDRVAKAPLVDTYFATPVTGFEESADGVKVTIDVDGHEEVLETEYLVGCDGGKSMVRDTSGINRIGSNFNQVMGLAVFRSRELHRLLDRFPPRSAYRIVDPALKGYWKFFGRVDFDEGDESFFFHAPVGTPDRAHDVDVDALLFDAVGAEFAYELEHFGLWDLRVQVAEVYRHGRVFIAGDAAHTHPPYGGFGLNNGLEDAVNLGWKLAGVLAGWAGDGLLDSYSPERQPVFRDIAEGIISAGIHQERDFLEAHSPEKDGAAFEELFREQSSREKKVRAYEPHYDGSPVIWGPADGASGAIGQHAVIARPGHHLTPLVLSTGTNVYEALGPWFNLIAVGAAADDVAEVRNAAAALGIPLEVICETADSPSSEYGSALVLVRPDQFIAWAGDSLDMPAQALLARVVGASGPPTPGEARKRPIDR